VQVRSRLGKGARSEVRRGGIPIEKPVAVTRKNSARPMSICWSNQRGASGARSETLSRRQDLCRAVEGQERMACSNNWGAPKQRVQVVSGLGLSHVVCTAR